MTAPASPDPVQPADAGQGLSEAERALGVYGHKVNASQVVFRVGREVRGGGG